MFLSLNGYSIILLIILNLNYISILDQYFWACLVCIYNLACLAFKMFVHNVLKTSLRVAMEPAVIMSVESSYGSVHPL